MSIESKARALGIILFGMVVTIIMLIGEIIWIATSSTAEVSTTSVPAEELETVIEVESVFEPKYTEDELFCMAAAIYNEAGADYCSDDTRRLVGYVILNRVKDSRYPNTIREVLEEIGQYGVFYYTGVKFSDRHTLPQEQHAVKRAYRIAEEVLESEFIPIPETVVFQAEFQQGTSIYKYQDGLYFCYAEEVR